MLTLTGGFHGAYLRADVLDQLGVRGMRTAIASGLLRAPWPRVLVEAARWTDVWTRSAAATLAYGPDVAVCGATAATLWGCDAAATPRTHLAFPPGRCVRARTGLVVRRCEIAAEDRAELGGVAVLALERVVVDVLCDDRIRAGDALAIADQALALRTDEQHRLQTQLARRIDARADRRGTIRARKLLDLATGRALAPSESRLLLAVVELGLPRPEVNWRLVSPWGTPLYCLDLAWPDLRIAAEYDGYAVHAERAAEDAERQADLERRGWILVRVSAADLRDVRTLDARLRRAFARRGYTW